MNEEATAGCTIGGGAYRGQTADPDILAPIVPYGNVATVNENRSCFYRDKQEPCTSYHLIRLH